MTAEIDVDVDGWHADPMATVSRAHTASLGPHDRPLIRSLLDDAFAGEFSDDDWHNTLGGIHVIAWDAEDIVAHVAVVQRRLVYGGRAWRTGYVEGLAVRADQRRRGLGSTLMAEAEAIIQAAYEVGALSDGTGIDGFYRTRGWRLWQGATSVLTPDGIVPTPDDDGEVYVLPTPSSPDFDVHAELTCDWRPGDVW